MSHLPLGHSFIVTTQGENQQRPQIDGEFIPTGPEYDTYQAQADATAMRDEIMAAYNGNSLKNFSVVRYEPLSEEVRPIQ